MIHKKTISLFVLVLMFVVGLGTFSVGAQTSGATSSDNSTSSLNTTNTSSSTATTTGSGTTSPAVTPGFPNTGAGGEMPLNVAVIISSGILAALGIKALARQKVSKK